MADIVEHRLALPEGTMLEHFRVGGVLGSGGFGITYNGWDTTLEKPVAIKEYLPSMFSVRENDLTVQPKSENDREDFDWGRERFLEEARTLARFYHANIVRVHMFIEAHGTAYIVMECIEGEPLSVVLDREGAMPEARVRELLEPILSAMAEIHRADWLHRDLKPANILIREDGTPVLIDFGAARYVSAAHSASVTGVLTEGYAPVEQYDSRSSRQGPWTDIYALGVLAYRMVTGVAKFPAATSRIEEDEVVPAVDAAGDDYGRALLEGIDAALQVFGKKRPQSIEAWQAMLFDANFAGQPSPASESSASDSPVADSEGGGSDDGGSADAPPNDAGGPQPPVGGERHARVTPAPEPARSSGGRMAAIAGIVAVLGVAGFLIYQQGQNDQAANERAAQQAAEAEVAAMQEQERLAAEAAEQERIAAEQAAEEAAAEAERIRLEAEAAAEAERLRLEAEAEAKAAEAGNSGTGTTQETPRLQGTEVERIERSGGQQSTVTEADIENYRKAMAAFDAGDYDRYALLLELAAREGYAPAQHELGQAYYYGWGVTEDEPEAVRWWRMAADQGYAAAEYSVGEAYYFGIVVAEDNDAAAFWFLRSAQQGNTEAQEKLGFMYLVGLGVPENIDQALHWFEEAAQQGSPTAMNSLGDIYETGMSGVPQSDREAARWYRKSANLGSDDGMNYLSWLLATTTDAGLRDGDEAWDYAARAIEAYPDWYPYRETLGASMAAAGDFSAAVHQQEVAIQLALEDEFELYDSAQIEAARERLRLYRNKQELYCPGGPCNRY